MAHVNSSRRKRYRKRNIPLQGLFFILLLFSACYALLSSSFFSLAEVQVKGNNQLKKIDIINLSGITYGTNIFRLKMSDIENKILLHPLVKEVSVNREFPRGLRIELNERIGKGVIPQNGSFLVVDEDAVYLDKETSLDNFNLPIITGIKPEKIKIGETIQSPNLQNAVYYLSAMPPKISSIISEINCKDQENIILYTLDGIEVRLGNVERAEEKLNCYLDVISQKYEEEIQYVDLSYYNKPVVKFKSPPKEDKTE